MIGRSILTVPCLLGFMTLVDVRTISSAWAMGKSVVASTAGSVLAAATASPAEAKAEAPRGRLTRNNRRTTGGTREARIERWRERGWASRRMASSSTSSASSSGTSATGGTGRDHLYKYVGCYNDSNGDLLDVKNEARRMSAEICYLVCAVDSYKYFGTQFAKECWCGNLDSLPEDRVLDLSYCDTDCRNSLNGEKCGGTYRMSLYTIEQSAEERTSVTDFTTAPWYVGCYADDATSRAMPDALYSNDTMGVEICIDYCTDLDYDFAGIGDGTECYCGDSYDSYGITDTCSTACKADTSEVCGGTEALSVYQTPTQ